MAYPGAEKSLLKKKGAPLSTADSAFSKSPCRPRTSRRPCALVMSVAPHSLATPASLLVCAWGDVMSLSFSQLFGTRPPWGNRRINATHVKVNTHLDTGATVYLLFPGPQGGGGEGASPWFWRGHRGASGGIGGHRAQTCRCPRPHAPAHFLNKKHIARKGFAALACGPGAAG